MVQIENEYGSYGCDGNYSRWLRDETLRHVSDKAVLFTADGPAQSKCGKIENVLATANFGRGQFTDFVNAKFQRKIKIFQIQAVPSQLITIGNN